MPPFAILNSILKPFRLEIRRAADPSRPPDPPRWVRPSYDSAQLPPDAAAQLRPDHPRLLELEKRYAGFDREVTQSELWRPGYVTADDLRYFRGDNAYVWQTRGGNTKAANYALTTYYVKLTDHLHLLDTLSEDGAFGAQLFKAAGLSVSRDLLDSILEIAFLERHLGVSTRPSFRVLDIGAGYGRLAHRMTTALRNVTYACTDAVAASTFISEYYATHRQLDRVRVLPLDEFDRDFGMQGADLAVNIHSFSECTTAAIDWWVSRLESYRIPHVMVVPNPMRSRGEELLTNRREDMTPIFERYGYRLKVKEPKYLDPAVQEFGLTPTHYYLFQRSTSETES